MTISFSRYLTLVALVALPIGFVQIRHVQAQETPKPATEATKDANKAVLDYLNFSDKQDFEDAKRGLVDAPATLTIKNAKGDVVWDLESYKKYIGIDKHRRTQ